MITKTVIIDGKEVTFAASAAIPRFYRLKFGRDILQDMRTIGKAMKGKDPENSPIPVQILTLFENVSYLMAKHAGTPGIPNSVEKWLDGFNTFSIYEVFPELQELWSENLKQINFPQKK